MPYTLWSHGQLLGHTDLAFQPCVPGVHSGWFLPTEIGGPAMDILTGVSRVVLNADGIEDRARLLAEMEAAADRAFALEVELHGENGDVIPTEDIGITDTHLSLEFADKAAARDAEAKVEVPRYQVIVRGLGSNFN